VRWPSPGKQRNPALPEVPTAIEQGVANYEVESWNALAAPAGTPPAQLQSLLASEIKRWREVISAAKIEPQQ